MKVEKNIQLTTGTFSWKDIRSGELHRKGEPIPGFQLRDAPMYERAVLIVHMEDGSDRVSEGEEAAGDAEVLRLAGVPVA